MQEGPINLPSNIDMSSCKQCGGVRTYYYRVVAMSADEVKARHNELKPTLSQFKLCTCPEPKAEHDGFLGEDKQYKVEWAEGYVSITSRPTLTEHVLLSRSEGVSLLTWLKQNQDRLEQEEIV